MKFPVLKHWDKRRILPGTPDSVPWGFLAPHERQAQRNHDQTLARLAERGGLSIEEMLVVVEDRKWERGMNEAESLAKLLAHLAAWERQSA